MESPWFIGLKGVPGWDRERSEAFVEMFATMGVRAVAGHNDDVVLFTIYDREAAEMFVEEMRGSGFEVAIASSKDDLVQRLR